MSLKDKAKPCDSLATTSNSGGTHKVSRCWGLAASIATAGHSKYLTGLCTWAQDWRAKQYGGVWFWNIVYGSCKQALRQRGQMFPYIRTRKEINNCKVQQMSCVHSMWWTSVLQTASRCGWGPFVLVSRNDFVLKYGISSASEIRILAGEMIFVTYVLN